MTSGLATRLRHAREVSGISGRQLGQIAGLSTSIVSHLENDRYGTPNGETLQAICAVLGISVDWLLSGNGPAPTDDAIRGASNAAKILWERNHRSAA